MNKIVLILPYFGKFPNYFNLWLSSAGYNSNINFLIFTDSEENYSFPNNVKKVKISFKELKNLIKVKLFCDNKKFILDRPYKLCDYRPAYGIIFEEYIKDYDFWGHCDPDIIWGNFEKFISDDILNLYDRIYTRGHLCIYRNTEKINNLFKIKLEKEICFSDVCTTKYSCHFDESKIITKLFEENGLKVYDEIDFADISYRKRKFELAQKIKFSDFHQIYEWNNGSLKGLFVTNINKNNEIEKMGGGTDCRIFIYSSTKKKNAKYYKIK